MNKTRVLVYSVVLVVGVAGALWVADTSDDFSRDYAAQNAERKRERAEVVELSERNFSQYVEYAFLFSVKEDEEGRSPVRFQAGVCLVAERAKAGQPAEAWATLVAKATVDMATGAQLSTATPEEAAVHLDNPSVQNILTFGEFESMAATIEAFRKRISTDAQTGAVPSPGTDAALEYGQALREAFVKQLTAHPEFNREFRAHLQRVSEDPSYPLPSIRWVD